MSLSHSKASLCLVATLALAAALGLSACSRSQSLTDSLTGPAHDGALALASGGNGKGHGHGGGGGGQPPPPPGPSTNPCASLNGLSGTVVGVAASIPQFRIGRLRIEVSGDTPAGTINATGICAAAANPAVSYFSGSGNVFLHGTTTSVTANGSAITFGPLLFPGLALEPGVVLVIDAAGNVLEIIWPGLAGLPPGPPILRLQLGQFSSSVQAGASLDATMQYNAKAPDGTTATFGVSASGMTVPPLKL